MGYLASLGKGRIIAALAIVVLVAAIVAYLVQAGHSSPAQAQAGCGPDEASVTDTIGSFSEYLLPHPQSDLMLIAQDRSGKIWFGEMGGNRLGMLDPSTGVIREWVPPHGEDGIMGIAVAPDNSIWFAEESANYLGHFNPHTCTFAITNLPGRDGFQAAPNGVAFAPDGRLWLTETSTSTIGAIDPATGKLQQFPLKPFNTNQPLIPYGVTVDAHGIVWFTELEGNAIGRLDPATGSVQTYPLQTPNSQPALITIAPDGRLWFNEMGTSRLGVLNPATGAIAEYTPPASYDPVAQLYDLIAAPDGSIWVTSSSANALLRLDPATGNWSRVVLPRGGSLPYGLVMDVHGGIWYAEASITANRIGYYAGAEKGK
jgi:virginiamycin B lyase